MKTLKLSSEIMRDLDEKSLQVTPRQALIRLLNNTKMDGVDGHRLYHKVALPLAKDATEFQFEDSDFALLKQAVEANPAGWPIILTAPLLDALQKATEIPLDSKPTE